MAITSRVTLKAAFEQGDKPQGSDYENWIDSFLHLTDTSAQAISSPVSFTGSATFVNINCADIDTSSINAAILTIGNIVTSALRATTLVSATKVYTDELEVNGSANFVDITCSGLNAALVSTGRITVSGVSAFSVWANRAEIVSAAIVSANLTDVSAGTINADNLIVTSASFTDAFLLNGARIRVTAAIPTAGQHAQGDIAFNSGPAAGGTVGWVNVVAGAPGTWKEFGVIEA